jgi:tetratricopeptide (TPR) repeat protein
MRAKYNFVFLIFSLVLLTCFLQVYSYFKEYFGDSKDLVAEATRLKAQVEREKLHTALVQNQLIDLREDVAKILPAHHLAVKNVADYRLEELGQSLRRPASVTSFDLSSVLMESGRAEFKKQNYEKAGKIFHELIEKYPVSTQTVEAHFLLGESLFQAGKYDDCLDVVYEMISQFPQSEMTGYLMLRNAQIMSLRKRKDEANEIYRLVALRFGDYSGLKDQARKLASEN